MCKTSQANNLSQINPAKHWQAHFASIAEKNQRYKHILYAASMFQKQHGHIWAGTLSLTAIGMNWQWDLKENLKSLVQKQSEKNNKEKHS